MTDYLAMAEDLFEYTRALRRDLHRHPELGFQEVRTSGVVLRELRQLGLEVHSGVAETGVVAMLEGSGPGPVVLLRFDMDALPIQEETGAEYASQVPGIMHACGHDGHTAVGLTVARLLNDLRDTYPGTIKLVFQPAEEGLGGARRMVAEGVLENPTPDFALACHLWNTRPLGWIGVTPGIAMAASDIFHVKIHGDGGHAASPHLTLDPVVAAAQAITAIQSIVSRNVPPLESAVVSVGRIYGGETYNVIPPEVIFSGTIRTFDNGIRQQVVRRFREVIEAVVEALGCRAEIEITFGTPAVINSPEIAARIQQVVENQLPEGELSVEERTMGSEDMAYMMEKIPGCYFFVGSSNHQAGLDANHHHPRFDFDERALPRASALMTASAINLLKG